MDVVQWIMSIGTSLFEAINLKDDLSYLRTSLPKSRLLIDQAEWGRFKNKELAVLLSQLKDTTCDAEDLLREFDGQVLRQKIEGADRSRAGTTTGGVFLFIEAFPSGFGHHGWLSIPAMAGLFSFPRSIGFVPLFLDAGKRCLMLCHAVYCCAGLRHPYLAAFRRQVAKFIAQISESNIICHR